MGWRKPTSRTAIGLDVGSRAIKAVQLHGRPGAWRVSAAGLVPRDGSDTIAAGEVRHTVQVLQRQGFTGRKVVLAMPPGRVVSSIMELPPAESGAPVKRIAQAELASMNRVDPATLQMGYWPLPATGRQRDGSRVMATGCSTADADVFLDPFEAEGLEVVALDVQATAMARLARPPAERTHITAMLDLGWQSGLLVLVYQGVVIYERRLAEVGLSKLTETIKSTLEVDDNVADCLLNEVGLGDNEALADPFVLGELHNAIRDHYQAMVQELSVSFGYAGHQYPDATVGRLVLVGGGAAISSLTEHLGAELNVPVSAVRIDELAQVPDGLNVITSNPALSLAMGLALHEEGR